MHYSELIVEKGYQGLDPVDFGFEECEPSHHFGPAVRGYWLLHYVVSGFGRFEKDGKVYDVGPGQIFVIPPRVTTFYQADGQRPWTYIWIGFKASSTLPVDLPEIITAPKLGELFEEMKHCSRLKGGKEAYLSAKIWQLFSVLLEQTNQKNDWIDIAISYINNNFHNQLSISEIAEKVGFERCYFSSAFKKRTGVAPQQYLMKLRMEKAAALMLNSGVKPSVAAVSVGYDDLFVFSKAFKKHFGCSPRNYVLMMLGEGE